MQKITYINEKGKSVNFTNFEPYFLQSITGTGVTNSTTQTQRSPYQDGETFIDTSLNKRFIDLSVVIFTKTHEDVYEKRRNLANIFNPKLKGQLIYTNDYTTKVIDVRVDNGVVFGRTTANRQECMISLTAYNPFWLDDFVTGTVFSFNIPLFEFTFELTEAGYELQSDGTNRTTLNNIGDVPTPVEIEFSGAALKPRITNETTGEFIEVDANIPAGSKLIISTEFGNKKVLIDNGSTVTNAFNQINLDSTFFNLEVGKNNIVYTAETGIDTASVLIRFTSRYLGV